MKFKKIVVCVLLTFIISTTLLGCKKELVCENLGIPTQERFDDGIRARCVWDMKIWNGKMYIGSGDYNDNTGPTDIWCYDFQEKTWNNSGSVPDESVLRFVEIDGTLYAPGIDPHEDSHQDDWINTNYYKLDGDTWQIFRNIPNGKHTFDMIKFDGKLFAGIGIVEGASPIYYSEDDGQTFLPLDIYKDGKIFETTNLGVVRTYEFFTLNDSLYAFIRYGVDRAFYGLFQYENGAMTYKADLTAQLEFQQLSMNMLNAKVEFKDKLYFSTGHLYSTRDGLSYEKLTGLGDFIVCDILVENDEMYVLCTKQKSTFTYTSAIYKTTSGNSDDFTEVLSFDYSTTALSFEKLGDTYYVGMGYKAKTLETNGTVLAFTFE